MRSPNRRSRTPRRAAAFAACLLILSACEASAPPAEEAEVAEGPGWRYHREYVFVGQLDGAPVAVPFAFRAATEGEGEIERQARGWLARGGAWDHFLDEEWVGPAVGGVWKVLPHGELGIASRGPLELEALWYRRGERQLRLGIGDPLTPWLGGERSRVRLLDGRLALGPEALRGMVVEEYDVTPAQAGRGPGRVRDQLVLAGGDSLRLLLTHSRGEDAGARGHAWLQRPGEARVWEQVEVEWVQARPLEEARRDVPTRWRFAIPGAGLTGEVSALGSQPEIGAERGGQRAAEVRYTVQGWVERNGDRAEVRGLARHEQG